MDFKGLLKKYWFVGLLGILLIVFIGVYAVDAYKNKELTVSSKQIDGNYIVYSVDSQDVTADEFFDSLYAKNGINCEYTSFQRAVLNAAYKTTDEMNTIASYNASSMYQQYGEEYIISQLQQMGYVDGTDDLANYYIDYAKKDLLVTDYVKAHENDIFKPFQELNNGRVIYHILVKVADITSNTDENGKTTYTANPTAEETQKLNDILAALKEKPFEEVAAQYSDDSSAAYGGYIGYIGNNNAQNYYPIFSETSLALGNNEVSDAITSQAGYHIIWNAGSSIDTVAADSGFLQAIQETYPTLPLKAVMEKANELGFEIIDEKLNSLITTQLESEDAE